MASLSQIHFLAIFLGAYNKAIALSITVFLTLAFFSIQSIPKLSIFTI